MNLLFFSIFLGKQAFAYDYEVNGVYYYINASSLTATVTYGDNPYEGAVFIPDSIIYKGKSLPVKYVGEFAFKDCTNLTSIQLGHRILEISSSAFEGCSNLTSMTIPSSVGGIGERAFYGCTNLTKLTIEDRNSTLRCSPSSVFDCKLKYLYIGRDIGYPEYGIIYNLDNTNLSTIIIGSGKTFISGFNGSKISTISIPANVTEIRKGCFRIFKNLSEI